MRDHDVCVKTTEQRFMMLRDFLAGVVRHHDESLGPVLLDNRIVLIRPMIRRSIVGFSGLGNVLYVPFGIR
jgi:hypothetical protein